MDRTGDDLFAATALTGDGDHRITTRDTADQLEDLLHRRGAANDGVIAQVNGSFRSHGEFMESLDFIASLQRTFDHIAEIIGQGFLAEKIVSPEFHGFNHGIGRWKAGGEDDHRVGIVHAQALEDFHAANRLHMQLADHQIGPHLRSFFQACIRAVTDDGADTFIGEIALGPLGEVVFRINQKDGLHVGEECQRGKVIRMVSR